MSSRRSSHRRRRYSDSSESDSSEDFYRHRSRSRGGSSRSRGRSSRSRGRGRSRGRRYYSSDSSSEYSSDSYSPRRRRSSSRRSRSSSKRRHSRYYSTSSESSYDSDSDDRRSSRRSSRSSRGSRRSGSRRSGSSRSKRRDPSPSDDDSSSSSEDRRRSSKKSSKKSSSTKSSKKESLGEKAASSATKASREQQPKAEQKGATAGKGKSEKLSTSLPKSSESVRGDSKRSSPPPAKQAAKAEEEADEPQVVETQLLADSSSSSSKDSSSSPDSLSEVDSNDSEEKVHMKADTKKAAGGNKDSGKHDVADSGEDDAAPVKRSAAVVKKDAAKLAALLEDDPLDVAAIAPLPHSATHWRRAFRAAKDKPQRQRDLRIIVEQQTQAALETGSYVAGDTEYPIDKAAIDAAAAGAKRVDAEGKPVGVPAGFTPHSTTAHFVAEDCLDLALFLKKREEVNPLVLVMASPDALGGKSSGSCAQEQGILRRTALHAAVKLAKEEYGPLPEIGGFYVPDVPVLRTAEARGYAWLPEPVTVSFICASSVVAPTLAAKAPKKSKRKKGNEGADDANLSWLSAEDRALMVQKVEALLTIAAGKGHESLVLSAWGCGYNGCPPHDVAAIFKQVIVSKFSNAFKHVTFALQDDENAFKAHNPKGNQEVFQEAFVSHDMAVERKKCVIM